MLANIHEQKHLMQQNLKVSMLDNILPKIESGVIYNLVTQKVINPYTMVLSALKHGKIKNLYIATYAINTKAISIFTNLLDSGDILNWTLVINHNLKYRIKGKEVLLYEAEKKYNNFKIIKKYTHAKVTLIEVGNKHIVITGSGNYSENPKIEQYSICDNEELFNFHKDWMTKRSI